MNCRNLFGILLLLFAGNAMAQNQSAGRPEFITSDSLYPGIEIVINQSINSGENLSGFRIANPETDKWIADDKFAHFGNGFVTATCAYLLTRDDDKILTYEIAGWMLWEIKDGYFPWEKHGMVGGDGFSYKDLIVSLAGVGAAILVHHNIK